MKTQRPHTPPGSRLSYQIGCMFTSPELLSTLQMCPRPPSSGHSVSRCYYELSWGRLTLQRFIELRSIESWSSQSNAPALVKTSWMAVDGFTMTGVHRGHSSNQEVRERDRSHPHPKDRPPSGLKTCHCPCLSHSLPKLTSLRTKTQHVNVREHTQATSTPQQGPHSSSACLECAFLADFLAWAPFFSTRPLLVLSAGGMGQGQSHIVRISG